MREEFLDSSRATVRILPLAARPKITPSPLHPFTRSLTFALLATAVCCVAQADESTQLPSVESIHVGFGNVYKLGCWTPIELVLSDTPGQGRGVEIQAADGDAVPARFPASPSASSGRRVLSYAKIGRPDVPVDVFLRGTDGQHAESHLLPRPSEPEPPRALPATNEFIVELGASVGLSSQHRVSLEGENDPGRRVAVTLDRPQRLPDEWYGYEGVDLVVIAGTLEVKHFFANPKSISALEHWVRLGGMLVIACSAECESLLAPGKPLARFAPGEFVRMTPLPPRGIANIEARAGAEGAGEQLGGGRLQFPFWRDAKGVVELSGFGERSSDYPLVIRRPLGFGQIIFVGLDLHEAPFAEWPRRTQFLESLLSRESQQGGRSTAKFDVSRSKSLGLVDLNGQLRGALDQFEEVQLIPFWTVASLALTYIGLLFPLNYWLSKRWSKRPQLPWVLFVLAAVVFSAGAYGFAAKAKGNRLRVNQIDLVDVDAETSLARGTTWFNVFSPKNEKFDLQMRLAGSGFKVQGSGPSGTRLPGHQIPDTHSLLSWLGLPGVGLGGMNSKAAIAPLFDEPYEIRAGQGGVAGVPISVWSSKAFVARWQTQAGGIEANLSEFTDTRPRGTIANSLNIPLTECVLVFGQWAWPIGTFTPGETKRVEDLDPQSLVRLENHLTKKQLSSMKEQILPYDRAALDAARIVEVMMFYEAAGGTNYTGLLHRHQRYIDLSSQLKFAKAILVGRATTGAVVEINGQAVPPDMMNRHDTIVRYVLPVKRVSEHR